MGFLPNLIIIGASKCGSSALHQYLDLHPSVKMSDPKELSFFCEDYNWECGIEWYKSHFPREYKVMGESSPAYTYASDWREVPSRIHDLISDVRLIYIVRDPLERTLSHYRNKYRKREEFRPLEVALTRPSLAESPYVDESKYYQKLSHYLQYFSQSHIQVVVLEHLSNNPFLTMQQVFKFIGVSDGFSHPAFDIPVNRSAPKKRVTDLGFALRQLRHNTALMEMPLPKVVKVLFERLLKRSVESSKLDNTLRRKLIDTLKPDTDKFRYLTGMGLDCWSI